MVSEMDNFTDNHFTKSAENAKLSLLLPGLGLAMGLGNHVIQRKDLSKDERTRHMLRSMLLGGLAGTGAELMRYGATNAINRFGSNDQIPDGVRGVIVPDPDNSETTLEAWWNRWNPFR